MQTFKTIGGREGIEKKPMGKRTAFHIDTNIVTYGGEKLKELGTFGRRRAENLIFIENSDLKPVFFYS